MKPITDNPGDSKHRCPDCWGTKGYTFHITQRLKLVGAWGEVADIQDQQTTKNGFVVCNDCGKRSQYQAMADKELVR